MNKTERIAMRIAVKNDSQSDVQIKKKVDQFLQKEDALLYEITQFLQRQINASNYEKFDFRNEMQQIGKSLESIRNKMSKI